MPKKNRRLGPDLHPVGATHASPLQSHLRMRRREGTGSRKSDAGTWKPAAGGL